MCVTVTSSRPLTRSGNGLMTSLESYPRSVLSDRLRSSWSLSVMSWQTSPMVEAEGISGRTEPAPDPSRVDCNWRRVVDAVTNSNWRPSNDELKRNRGKSVMSSMKTRKSCFSYRTGFHCYTVLLLLKIDSTVLLFLQSFYCSFEVFTVINVSSALLFLWSFYCFSEASTVSTMFLLHCSSYSDCQYDEFRVNGMWEFICIIWKISK